MSSTLNQSLIWLRQTRKLALKTKKTPERPPCRDVRKRFAMLWRQRDRHIVTSERDSPCCDVRERSTMLWRQKEIRHVLTSESENLPHVAFVGGVHGGVHWTVESFGKFHWIRYRCHNPTEESHRMSIKHAKEKGKSGGLKNGRKVEESKGRERGRGRERERGEREERREKREKRSEERGARREKREERRERGKETGQWRSYFSRFIQNTPRAHLTLSGLWTSVSKACWVRPSVFAEHQTCKALWNLKHQYHGANLGLVTNSPLLLWFPITYIHD